MIKKLIYFLSDNLRRYRLAAKKKGYIKAAQSLILEFYYDYQLKLKTPNLQFNIETTENKSIHKDSNRNIPGSFFYFYKSLHFIKINPKESHLLDIGCGTGKIMCAAIKSGFKSEWNRLG